MIVDGELFLVAHPKSELVKIKQNHFQILKMLMA